MSIRRLEGVRGNCRGGSLSGLCVQDRALAELAYRTPKFWVGPWDTSMCVTLGIHE